MEIKVAYNLIDNSFAAGRNLALDIKTQFTRNKNIQEPTNPEMIFLFCSVAHKEGELIEGINTVFPDVPVCGCTVFGNITSLGCDDSTYSVNAIGFFSPEISFHPFLMENIESRDLETGRDLAEKINKWRKTEASDSLLFIFPDAWSSNVENLIQGIDQGIDKPLEIAGGMASDDYQTEETRQFIDDRFTKSGLSGCLLHGDFSHQIAISHGSRCIGPECRITEYNDNRILKINDEPALDFLLEHLGDSYTDYGQLANVVGLGFPFKGNNYSQEILLRAIMAIDDNNKSLKIGSRIPDTKMHLCFRDQRLIADSTEEMTRELRSRMNNPDKSFYIYINCDGRGTYLYGEPDPDVNTMRKALGEGIDFSGFFTFGEIGAYQGKNMLHNYTGILIGIEGK